MEKYWFYTISKKNPDFTKIYYSCLNSEKKKDGRCVKHVYISKKNDFDVLVYYSGKIFKFKHHEKTKLDSYFDIIFLFRKSRYCYETYS